MIDICPICGSEEGEYVEGHQISIGLNGICDRCASGVAKLERIFKADFEFRTGKEILRVIPYPLFFRNHFTFPPYSEVYSANSYMANDQSVTPFAIGIAKDCLIAGRRSWLSIWAEVKEEKEELEEMRRCEPNNDKMKLIDAKLAQVNYRIDKINRFGRVDKRTHFLPWESLQTDIGWQEFNEGRLFYLPYCYASRFRMKIENEWITVHIPHVITERKFWGGVRKRKKQAYWRLHASALPMVELIDTLIEYNGDE